MKIAKLVCPLLIVLMSLMGFMAIYQPTATLAQGEQQEKIELTTPYTKLEGTSGASFEFEVELTYLGSEARSFELVPTGPKDWTIYVTPSYPKEKHIGDIRLEPGETYGQKVEVYVAPPVWLRPEPGEYDVTLEAISAELKGTIDLKAIVTATYQLSLTPSLGLYNTTATAGKDNNFSVTVQNNGSDTINNITFSSTKPKDWTVDFSPNKIDSLIAGNSQTINVNIKPPPKTIAGDYSITLKASGNQASDDISDLRVTVETSTVWGWVGVGIIVLVIAGLAVIFMRFSRR